MTVFGKSIGGGLPLAGVTGGAEVMDAVPPGGLGGTFGGNPLSCAAALAVLDVVTEPEFLAGARELGEHAARAARRRSPRATRTIGEVRGLGSMLAFEFAERTPDRATGGRRSRVRARPRPSRPAVSTATSSACYPLSTSRRTSWTRGSPSWRSRLAPEASAPDISVRGLTKRYGDVVAVDGSTSTSRRGEFFTMLGPSGSGKTTTLRMIAGFEIPDEGHDRARGRGRVAAPALRPAGQHGLPGLRAVPAHDRAAERRVRAHGEEGARRASGTTRARGGARDGAARRRTATASRRSSPAGQRQRVALARAIVNQPAGAPPRRAARRARPQAPPGDADRAEVDPARGRHHLRLRDARPGRGADDVATGSPSSTRAGSSRSARLRRSTSTRRASSSPASSASRT